MPVVAIGLVVQVGLAMISRAAPSLQIFSVGFAVLFASTVAALMASFEDVAGALGSHFARLAPTVEALITAMKP
jgi:flagellar biosynthesis protein FliR